MNMKIKSYQFSRQNSNIDLSAVKALRRAAKSKEINGRTLLEDLSSTCVQIIRYNKRKHMSDDDQKELSSLYEDLKKQYDQITELLKDSNYTVRDILAQGYPDIIKNNKRLEWLHLNDIKQTVKTTVFEKDNVQIEPPAEKAQSNKDDENEDKANSDGIVVDLDDLKAATGKELKAVNEFNKAAEHILKENAEGTPALKSIKDENKTLWEKAKDFITDAGTWKGILVSALSMGGMFGVVLVFKAIKKAIAMGGQYTKVYTRFYELKKKSSIASAGNGTKINEKLIEKQAEKATEQAIIKHFETENAANKAAKAGKTIEKGPTKGGELNKISKWLFKLGMKSPGLMKFLGHVDNVCSVAFGAQLGVWIGEAIESSIYDNVSSIKGNKNFAKHVANSIRNMVKQISSSDNQNQRAFTYLDFEHAKNIDIDRMHRVEDMVNNAECEPLAIYYDNENKTQQGVLVVSVKNDQVFRFGGERGFLDKESYEEVYVDKNGERHTKTIKADDDARRETCIWAVPNNISEDHPATILLKMRGVEGDMMKRAFVQIFAADIDNNNKIEPIYLSDGSGKKLHYIIFGGDSHFADYQYLLNVDTGELAEHADVIFKGNANLLVKIKNELQNAIIVFMNYCTSGWSHAAKTAMMQNDKDDLIAVTGTMDPMAFGVDAVISKVAQKEGQSYAEAYVENSTSVGSWRSVLQMWGVIDDPKKQKKGASGNAR